MASVPGQMLPKVASPRLCNGPWLWKRHPSRSGPCSGEEPTHFLAGYILRSFSLPFQPGVAPWPPPEQHGTLAASPVLCLTPPHPVWVAPRGGRHPQRVTFPSLPRFGLSPKNPGNTTLPGWARETNILRSPWKVGGQAPGADTANFPTRGTQHRATEAPPVLGARSPPSRSTLPLKALGEGPSRLFQLPLEPPPQAFLARGHTPAVSARGHIPPERLSLCV